MTAVRSVCLPLSLSELSLISEMGEKTIEQVQVSLPGQLTSNGAMHFLFSQPGTCLIPGYHKIKTKKTKHLRGRPFVFCKLLNVFHSILLNVFFRQIFPSTLELERSPDNRDRLRSRVHERRGKGEISRKLKRSTHSFKVNKSFLTLVLFWLTRDYSCQFPELLRP